MGYKCNQRQVAAYTLIYAPLGIPLKKMRCPTLGTEDVDSTLEQDPTRSLFSWPDPILTVISFLTIFAMTPLFDCTWEGVKHVKSSGMKEL